MFDRNLKFPIIGFGIGTTDSKGQLIEVHFTQIIDQGNELFNAFSKIRNSLINFFSHSLIFMRRLTKNSLIFKILSILMRELRISLIK